MSNTCPICQQDLDETECTHCPICQQDLEKAPCPHWVATLSDDSDGYDTDIPLYMGWAEHWTELHESIFDSFEEYCCSLSELADTCLRKGQASASMIIGASKDLPDPEGVILSGIIEDLLAEGIPNDTFESAEEYIKSECGQQFKKLFTALYCRANKGSAPVGWEIGDDYPGRPTWTGTDYWAEDAITCIQAINKECRLAAARLCELKSLC